MFIKNTKNNYQNYRQYKKQISLNFYSDTKCNACHKMYRVIERLKIFLSTKNIDLHVVYKPIITKQESLDAAFIAANAIRINTIDSFLKQAYPKDFSKLDDVNPQLIAAELNIPTDRNQESKSMIKKNQNMIKTKSNNIAPLIVIKRNDNREVSLSGCRDLECLIKILKDNKII